MTTLHDLPVDTIKVLIQVLDGVSVVNFSLTASYFRKAITAADKEYDQARIAYTKATLLFTTFESVDGLAAFKSHVISLRKLASRFYETLNSKYPKAKKETDFRKFVESHRELKIVNQGELLVARKSAEMALHPFVWNFESKKTKICNFVLSKQEQKKNEGTKKRKSTVDLNKNIKRPRKF